MSWSSVFWKAHAMIAVLELDGGDNSNSNNKQKKSSKCGTKIKQTQSQFLCLPLESSQKTPRESQISIATKRHKEGAITDDSTYILIWQYPIIYKDNDSSGPGSIPGQVMWDLCPTKFRWGRFSPSTSVSPANSHSTKCSIIINHSIVDAMQSRYGKHR
jgi:hypothetical protein